MTMTKAIRAWFERLNDLVGLVGAERGIGRTHRAIAALEPGQVYIVHTAAGACQWLNINKLTFVVIASPWLSVVQTKLMC